MSNIVEIIPTEFRNVRSGVTSYGYRIYDDYECFYHNLWESIPESDIEFLVKVIATAKEEHSNALEMLRFCVQEEKGISIDMNYYEYDQIKQHLAGL